MSSVAAISADSRERSGSGSPSASRKHDVVDQRLLHDGLGGGNGLFAAAGEDVGLVAFRADRRVRRTCHTDDTALVIFLPESPYEVYALRRLPAVGCDVDGVPAELELRRCVGALGPGDDTVAAPEACVDRALGGKDAG